MPLKRGRITPSQVVRNLLVLAAMTVVFVVGIWFANDLGSFVDLLADQPSWRHAAGLVVAVLIGAFGVVVFLGLWVQVVFEAVVVYSRFDRLW